MHVWGVWRVWWGPIYRYDACLMCMEDVVMTYLLLWCMSEMCRGCGEDLSTVMMHVWGVWRIWWGPIYCYDACLRCMEGVVRTYLLLWYMSEVYGGCGEDLYAVMMHVWSVWRVWWWPIYCYDACLRCVEVVVRTYLLLWCMSDVYGGCGEDLSTAMRHVWGVWRVWWGHIYCYGACLRCLEGVVRTYVLLWCMYEVCWGCCEDLSTVMMHVWGVWRKWLGHIYWYDACLRFVEGVVWCYVAYLRCVEGGVRTYLLLWCMSEVYGGCDEDLSTVMMHVWGVWRVWRVWWGPILL